MSETELRKHLVTLYVHLKEHQDSLTSIMNHLASLRDVLKEASPKFAQTFDDRLKHWENLTASSRVDSNKVFDEIIAALKIV